MTVNTVSSIVTVTKVSNTKVKSTLSTVSNTKIKSTVSTVSSTKMKSTVSRIEYYFEEANRV